MAKRISMTLSAASIGRAIKEIDDYGKRLLRLSDMLAARLAEHGLNVARIGFMTAHYDGLNDVTTSVKRVDAEQYAIIAQGNSVAFIEFGTGVANPEHPQADALNVKHGSYGKGQGAQLYWVYYGTGGTDGRFLRETEKGSAYAPVADDVQPAYADTKYLVDRVSITDAATEEDGPEGEHGPAPVHTVMITSYCGAPLTPIQAMNLLDEHVLTRQTGLAGAQRSVGGKPSWGYYCWHNIVGRWYRGACCDNQYPSFSQMKKPSRQIHLAQNTIQFSSTK